MAVSTQTILLLESVSQKLPVTQKKKNQPVTRKGFGEHGSENKEQKTRPAGSGGGPRERGCYFIRWPPAWASHRCITTGKNMPEKLVGKSQWNTHTSTGASEWSKLLNVQKAEHQVNKINHCLPLTVYTSWTQALPVFFLSHPESTAKPIHRIRSLKHLLAKQR